MTPVDPEGVDAEDMLGVVERSPDQWAKALTTVRDAALPGPRDVDAVVVAGMGGSGITADLAAALAATVGTVPVLPVKGYALPAWAPGRRTLVVAVSHSGNTEETLAVVRQAVEQGLDVQVVTSGGRVGDIAEDADLPVVEIPGGGQPRAAFPTLAAATLGILDAAGVLPGVMEALDAVPDELRDQRSTWGERPRAVARSLAETVPVFVAGRGLPAVVALRARCQVEENAERPALAYELPEADHNSLVGWAAGGRPVPSYGVVAIQDPDQHPRVSARFPPTLEALGGQAHVVEHLSLEGPTPLVRAMAGVYFLDLVSVHLALQAGIDPTPVDVLVALKERLREDGG